MAVPQTSTCVVTLGGGASASYTMQEGNWKVIRCEGKVVVAGSAAANATVEIKKNASLLYPFTGGVMAVPAGTQLQKNNAAGVPFFPTAVPPSQTLCTLAQFDTLNLTSDTAGQVEVYITLQRV